MTYFKLSLLRFVKSPVKVFVLLAVSFGLVIILLSPPLTGADEEAHFIRAWGISEGTFSLHNTTEVEIPKSYRQTIGCFQTKTSQPGNIYGYNYKAYGIDKNKAFGCALGLSLNQENTEIIPSTAAGYSPTAYIPQTLAILIGKLLNAPMVLMVYAVRIAVLIAYVAMIVLAIRLLPVRKWALVGVALLPHSITHFTNPGGDYILYGTVAIFVAIIIRSIYLPQERLREENKKLLITMGITAFFMVLPKGFFPGVCFLPLLAFYGGLKYEKIKKVMLFSAAITVAFLWQKFGAYQMPDTVQNAGSVLNFPYAFIKTMFLRWVDTDFIYKGDSVGNFPVSGNHLGMPSILITLLNVLFAGYLFVGYPEKYKIQISSLQTKLLKYIGLLCAIAVIVGTFGALYTAGAYLQDGSLVIRGVSTRYFYPAFFMLALIPFSRYFRTEQTKHFSELVIVGSMILLLTTVLLKILSFHWFGA